MPVLSCNFSFSPWRLPSNYSSMSWCSFLQLKKRLTSFKHANFHLGWQHNRTPPVATQLLDPVESREWGEGEGRDGPSQQQASKICLSIARSAKGNWYMTTESLLFCGETDISAHLSISVTHTMIATPSSPQVQQQFTGL